MRSRTRLAPDRLFRPANLPLLTMRSSTPHVPEARKGQSARRASAHSENPSETQAPKQISSLASMYQLFISAMRVPSLVRSHDNHLISYALAASRSCARPVRYADATARAPRRACGDTARAREKFEIRKDQRDQALCVRGAQTPMRLGRTTRSDRWHEPNPQGCTSLARAFGVQVDFE